MNKQNAIVRGKAKTSLWNARWDATVSSGGAPSRGALSEREEMEGSDEQPAEALDNKDIANIGADSMEVEAMAKKEQLRKKKTKHMHREEKRAELGARN